MKGSTREPARALATGSLPLGIVDELQLDSHTVPIPPTAVIAVYTDGMVEFARDTVTAECRLQTAVALLVGDTTLSRPALTVKEIVFQESVPRDDAALLLMQFTPDDAPVRPSPLAPLERAWRFHSSHAFTAAKMRSEIVAYLRELATDNEGLQTAQLIVGEVVANTVTHAPGLVDVSIDWSDEKPMLAVVDAAWGSIPSRFGYRRM